MAQKRRANKLKPKPKAKSKPAIKAASKKPPQTKAARPQPKAPARPQPKAQEHKAAPKAAAKAPAKKEINKDDPNVQQAIVKKLMALGKPRGYITYDELNAVLPPEEFSPEVIDAAISALASADINV